jgi:hypothetical protein
MMIARLGSDALDRFTSRWSSLLASAIIYNRANSAKYRNRYSSEVVGEN